MSMLKSPVAALFAFMIITAPAYAQAQCLGDCDASNDVTVDEIITGVNIGLGVAELSSCPAFDGNDDEQTTVEEIITAVTNALEGCMTTGEGLGRRTFSLSNTSTFEVLGLPLALQTHNLSGFLELEAGAEDPNGIRPLSLTDASDFISISLTPPIGSPITICLKPVFDSLPLADIGSLACHGFDMMGVEIQQDHNTNDIDPECTEGTREAAPLPHVGICNGPLTPVILEGDPGNGAAAITPDPDTLEGGLQFEIIVEDALPCGDEGASGTVAPFVLNTGIGKATVFDQGNTPNRTLRAERTGENFDCDHWTEEDGPGRFVFLAPILDFDTGVLGRVDTINVFSLDD